MTCTHCGGNHYSDYCTGYNSASMNRSLDEINGGINHLSGLNEEALGKMDSIADEISSAGYQVSGSIDNLSNTTSEGFNKLSNSVDEAAEKIWESQIISGFMISQALIGIGAIMQYRERMEQLRHKERMQFNEDKSVAGRARRELKTASTLLFVDDPKQAENHIKNSIELFPSSAETFRMRSIIESRQEKHNDAITSLKVALKFAEDGDLIPTLLIPDSSQIEEVKQKIITSSLAQISQEFSIIGKIKEAIPFLTNGLEIYPNNTDLHFQRIRTISKTNSWDNYFEEYVSCLIELSPKYYSILYVDQQLKDKRTELRKYLIQLKKEKSIQLQNKVEAFTILSKGNKPNLQDYDIKSPIEKLSYNSIMNNYSILTNEIKNYL